MYFDCECGASVHLSTRLKKKEELPINLMCLDCFKANPVELFEIEYEIPPLRAVYWSSVLAVDSFSAKEIFRQLKDEPSLKIRRVKEKGEGLIEEQEVVV